MQAEEYSDLENIENGNVMMLVRYVMMLEANEK